MFCTTLPILLLLSLSLLIISGNVANAQPGARLQVVQTFCKPFVSVLSQTKGAIGLAHTQARKQWEEKVRRRYGAAYASFWMARTPRFICLTDRSGLNGLQFYCRLRARPCFVRY